MTPRRRPPIYGLNVKRAGARIHTAPDFIRGCGTASSTTGEAYRIRFQNGREISCADFLWTELKKLDPSIS